MEITVYDLINALQRVADKNIPVKVSSYGNPDVNISDIAVIGFLDNKRILRIILKDA